MTGGVERLIGSESAPEGALLLFLMSVADVDQWNTMLDRSKPLSRDPRPLPPYLVGAHFSSPEFRGAGASD